MDEKDRRLAKRSESRRSSRVAHAEGENIHVLGTLVPASTSAEEKEVITENVNAEYSMEPAKREEEDRVDIPTVPGRGARKTFVRFEGKPHMGKSKRLNITSICFISMNTLDTIRS